MEETSNKKTWWRQLLGRFRKEESLPVPPSEEDAEVCCGGVVHIAYRGIADDHLYMAYGKKWGDVRFFRPNGLRVFCADCRRRLL